MIQASDSSIELAMDIARKMNLSDEELRNMRRGAILHDIGELGVPPEVMQKTGFLNEVERAMMMKHTQIAHDMFNVVEYLKPAMDIPYCHHERWNGSGYPRGLKGTQIPIAARIFAVVDVWEAMRTDRPHNPAWPDNVAMEYIRKSAGELFDPQVVRVFLEVIQQKKESLNRLANNSAPHHDGEIHGEQGHGIN